MTHPIDAHVGSQIREYRHAQRITQSALADAIGVKFQQVQKYETGANRVSASRLAEIAKFFDVPINAFFPDCPQEDQLSGEEMKLLLGYRQANPSIQGVLKDIAEKSRASCV